MVSFHVINLLSNEYLTFLNAIRKGTQLYQLKLKTELSNSYRMKVIKHLKWRLYSRYAL